MIHVQFFQLHAHGDDSLELETSFDRIPAKEWYCVSDDPFLVKAVAVKVRSSPIAVSQFSSFVMKRIVVILYGVQARRVVTKEGRLVLL